MSYIADRRFTKDDVQLLFKLRTKMLDCKSNFKTQFQNNLSCRICELTDSIEDEDHLLICIINNNEAHSVTFNDVYGSIDKQFEVVKIFKNVMRKRKVYLDTLSQPSQ